MGEQTKAGAGRNNEDPGHSNGKSCAEGHRSVVAVVNGKAGGRALVRWQRAIDEWGRLMMRDKRAKQRAAGPRGAVKAVARG